MLGAIFRIYFYSGARIHLETAIGLITDQFMCDNQSMRAATVREMGQFFREFGIVRNRIILKKENFPLHFES